MGSGAFGATDDRGQSTEAHNGGRQPANLGHDQAGGSVSPGSLPKEGEQPKALDLAASTKPAQLRRTKR
jgi:hypothetical protein